MHYSHCYVLISQLDEDKYDNFLLYVRLMVPQYVQFSYQDLLFLTKRVIQKNFNKSRMYHGISSNLFSNNYIRGQVISLIWTL